MNSRQWKAAIKPINEEFYYLLVNGIDCGPFDGGCLLVAKALQSVIGGEIHVTVDSENRADHAGVLKDGKLWDYNGPAAPARFIARFNRLELSHVPDYFNVRHRPYSRFRDLRKAPQNHEVEQKVAALFRTILQISPRPHQQPA